jgi:hypothetical protein
MTAHGAKLAKQLAASGRRRDYCRDRVALFIRRVRRGRLGEFLEARIIPKRIEHGIEPEQRRSERHHLGQQAVIRYRE